MFRKATAHLLMGLGGEDDADTIAAFNRAMARGTEAREIPPGLIEAGVRGMLANPSLGFYVVAEIDGRTAGCLMVTYEWSDWRNGLFWWVQSVYVAQPFRRRGIYRSLYEWVRERAREAESAGNGRCCGFRLYVEKENVAAQRTYQALGMRQCDYLMYEEERRQGVAT